MGRFAMRRSLALALAFVLSSALLGVPSRRAAAQEPLVRLTLLEQSPPWNGPGQQHVTIRIHAENAGQEPLEDLSIGVTLWPPVLSRTGFEESLSADPADAAALLAETRPRSGTLAPGASRDFFVPIDLPLEQFSSTQTLVYPLKVDLRSGYQSIAAIRTPVIYVVRKPLYPLALSWTFVLSAPLDLRPDGTFASPALETSISRGGRLAGQLSALTHAVAGGVGVDVVVSPLLLYQLLQMRDGYRVLDRGSMRSVRAGEGGSAAASAALERLHTIANAPNVELSALPFSEPLLPSVSSGRLSSDLGVQLQAGRQLVVDALGASSSTTVLRPPRSAVDGASLDRLPASGVSTLLLDPAVVPRREDAQGFAPPPVVSIAAQNATLSAVVADPAVQAMLSSGLEQEQPVLAAQAMLGELASIWLQRPGEPHGLAMILGDDVAPPGSFYVPFVRGVSTAPWLSKRTASALAADPDAVGTEAPAEIVSTPSAFTTTYVDAIRSARRRVETLRSMLVRPSGQPGHLDRLLLLAESQRFVGDEPAGAAFVGRVDDAVASVFGAVRPQVSQPITLTSSAIRDVPIAVQNTASMPLRVTIRLSSPHLQDSVERTRVLPARSTVTVGMDLELRTTGRFGVPVQVLAPSGQPIGRATVLVRSTAYNRIALLITIGAALLALLVWARRFVVGGDR
jgi:hypothetical protein